MPRVAATLLALMILTACAREDEPRHDSHFYAMGTRIEITVRAQSGAAAEAHAALAAEAATLHQRWDAWGDGALGTLNASLSHSDTAAVPTSIQAGIERALSLAKASGGLFHPGIGELVETWGFHRQPRPQAPPPSPQTVTAVLQRLPPIDAMNLENGRLDTGQTGARLDLGGFAKGLALEKLGRILGELGIRHGLINAGGDLIVLGDAGGRDWQIGILDPRGDGVLASVAARDGECIITSGDYERDFIHEGERFHHLLDPRTGRPAQATASATVIDEDCARADAAATALFVAGPGHWSAVASAMGVDRVMLITPGGQAELSPAMRDRIRFQDREPLQVVRELP